MRSARSGAVCASWHVASHTAFPESVFGFYKNVFASRESRIVNIVGIAFIYFCRVQLYRLYFYLDVTTHTHIVTIVRRGAQRLRDKRDHILLPRLSRRGRETANETIFICNFKRIPAIIVIQVEATTYSADCMLERTHCNVCSGRCNHAQHEIFLLSRNQAGSDGSIPERKRDREIQCATRKSSASLHPRWIITRSVVRVAMNLPISSDKKTRLYSYSRESRKQTRTRRAQLFKHVYRLHAA